MTSVGSRARHFKEKLKERKKGTFELRGEYVTMRTRAKFIHNLCGHEWMTQPVNIMNAKGLLGCPNCQYREKSGTTEEFKKDLNNAHEGAYSLVDGEEYINNREKLNVVHDVCGTVSHVSPVSILHNGSCPSCRLPSRPQKTTKEFQQDLRSNKGEEYRLSLGSAYRGANEKVRIEHTTCGYEWDVRASHILYRSDCPNCIESKGERFISEYLSKEEVLFEREYRFTDCINYKELPFDFAVFDKDYTLKGLIEYDGVQHYKPFKHFGGEDKFNKQKNNDNIKNIYCRNNKIELLRVPYTTSKPDIIKLINNLIVEK